MSHKAISKRRLSPPVVRWSDARYRTQRHRECFGFWTSKTKANYCICSLNLGTAKARDGRLLLGFQQGNGLSPCLILQLTLASVLPFFLAEIHIKHSHRSDWRFRHVIYKDNTFLPMCGKLQLQLNSITGGRNCHKWVLENISIPALHAKSRNKQLEEITLQLLV